MPKFETEAEEVQWWHDHRDAVEENLIEAMKEGTAHRGGPAAMFRETRVIRVRMANTDIERMEKLAEEKGCSNQACINRPLHEGLDREDAGKRQNA